MKHTGRMISLLIVVISLLGFLLYTNIAHDYLDVTAVFVSAFYLFLGWWLGKHYDKVKFLSEKDVLTGSYNRRFIMDLFPKLKRISDRKAQKLIIFLIDVDDFKSINDHYDHATGDQVLQLIASTLKKSFRDSDYIVRWGGDEFVGILPCVEQSGMNGLQTRLHNELNKLSNTISVPVSVSVGYATYPDEGVELNDLIKIADRKMYSDKCNKNNKQIIGSLKNNGIDTEMDDFGVYWRVRNG
ncbi:GGDEF domain-containing protein [Paenibacillus baekrokdamisoli]|uniref:GGDEF domain-containing protein n=1 Tax=Paenibacillus baekrokdamisoli TaxID=1712516 RepID=A0A3G9IVB2_9BACL|nr:GGDEF domain-containing protein [Paenibacillus baekrokdamisoli]MBB3072551.1 diguanylate cyclase (GGDEF)-like protein [Paenibacillus baekrokdamisoli]BBH22396.1 GGDEF domain-containing protein [Paenibacillus baekrokdamisoli]